MESQRPQFDSCQETVGPTQSSSRMRSRLPPGGEVPRPARAFCGAGPRRAKGQSVTLEARSVAADVRAESNRTYFRELDGIPARCVYDADEQGGIDMEPECPQPFCLLQRDGVDRGELAEILLRLLAGEEISALRPSPPRDSRGACLSCVERIMDGKGPLTWGRDHEDMVAGWKSYRRERRRRARERAI